METANFTNPLVAVQAIPIFIYLNTLSDFLYGENFLYEKHLYQPIPIVNALYHYFFDNDEHIASTSLETKKIFLAGKLINGTDYYGTKENEPLDENFINALYKHIITSLVFEKYINIYGFIAEIVYRSKELNLQTFYTKIRNTLSKAKFQNEYGPDTSLEPIAVDKICRNLIFPMFPKPDTDLNLISVDYIYGQAGAIFQLAVKNPPIIKQFLGKKNGTTDKVNKFTKFKILAHAVEQSVNAGKANVAALRIFTLPALIHYVYKEKEHFKFYRIKRIVNNPTHIKKAIELLFLYLNTSISQIEKAQKDDYRYQFHLAMSQFKSRSTLAKEIINTTCSGFTKEDLENAVTGYENNPGNYKCNNKVLPNINNIYQEQVDNITKRYFVYEQQSMREAFGINRVESLNDKVKISEGFYFQNPSRFATSDMQLISHSNNMFRFYFRDNGTYAYYAFVREDNEIILLQGSDDDEVFKKKLGLRGETFENSNFYTKNRNYAPVKTINEFFDAIAEERKIELSKSLFSSGYDQTKKEWWIDFGLSLIPFYSCVQGIKSNNVEDATVSCSLDVFFLLPIVGEFGNLASKLVTATTRSVLSLTGATLESIMLRTALRKTLSTTGRMLVKEVVSEFSSVLTKKTFKNLGLSVVRFLDPGFELLFNIGKGGYRFLGELITKALGKNFISTKVPSLIRMLEKCEERIATVGRKVDVMKERDVYVNFISKQQNSGYGYKYINLPGGKIAEIRRIAKSGEEILVVFDRTVEGNQKIYKTIDPVTGDVINKELYEHNGHLYEQPISRRSELKLNIECKKLRRKRTPMAGVCLTTSVLNSERIKHEEDAVNYAVQKLGMEESLVRDELRHYIFPGKGELQFILVQNWDQAFTHNNLHTVNWGFQYRIADAEMFARLRYEEILDKAEFTEIEARKIIRSMFETNPDMHLVSLAPRFTSNFQSNELYKYVTFKDFCALKNYVYSGRLNVGSATLQSKCMREALYRLAIRQFDRIGQFPRTLYRAERRSWKAVTKLFYSEEKYFKFNTFTLTSTVEETAKGYTGRELFKEFGLNEFVSTMNDASKTADFKDVDVVYKMEFDEPYLCANLQNGFNNLESEVVLLPGASFKIKSKLAVHNEDIVMVELSYIPNYTSKELMFKNAMDELEKIKKNVILPQD